MYAKISPPILLAALERAFRQDIKLSRTYTRYVVDTVFMVLSPTSGSLLLTLCSTSSVDFDKARMYF